LLNDYQLASNIPGMDSDALKKNKNKKDGDKKE